ARVGRDLGLVEQDVENGGWHPRILDGPADGALGRAGHAASAGVFRAPHLLARGVGGDVGRRGGLLGHVANLGGKGAGLLAGGDRGALGQLLGGRLHVHGGQVGDAGLHGLHGQVLGLLRGGRADGHGRQVDDAGGGQLDLQGGIRTDGDGGQVDDAVDARGFGGKGRGGGQREGQGGGEGLGVHGVLRCR